MSDLKKIELSIDDNRENNVHRVRSPLAQSTKNPSPKDDKPSKKGGAVVSKPRDTRKTTDLIEENNQTIQGFSELFLTEPGPLRSARSWFWYSFIAFVVICCLCFFFRENILRYLRQASALRPVLDKVGLSQAPDKAMNAGTQKNIENRNREAKDCNKILNGGFDFKRMSGGARRALLYGDCAIYANQPGKLLNQLGSQSEFAANKALHNQEYPLLFRLIIHKAYFQSWQMTPSIKEVKASCRQWSESEECVERLICDALSGESGPLVDRGYGILAGSKKFRNDLKAFIFLAGARLSMLNRNYAQALQRLGETEALAIKSLAVRKEKLELHMMAAALMGDRALVRSLFDESKKSFKGRGKSELLGMQLIYSLFADQNKQDVQREIAQILSRIGKENMAPLDPNFFPFLSQEILVAGQTDGYLAMLARIKARLSAGASLVKSSRCMVDQWAARAYLIRGEFKELEKRMAAYGKDCGNDPFFYHYSAVQYIKNREEQFGALKAGKVLGAVPYGSIQWETLYLKGMVLIRLGQLSDIPLLMNLYASRAAQDMDAQFFAYFLRSEYLLSQNKFEAAEAQIDESVAKYGGSRFALEFRKKILEKKNKGQIARQPVANSPNYGDTGAAMRFQKRDPLGPFALMN
jgi:hypothetical protein